MSVILHATKWLMLQLRLGCMPGEYSSHALGDACQWHFQTAATTGVMTLFNKGQITVLPNQRGLKCLFCCHTTQNTGHGGGGRGQDGICKKVRESIRIMQSFLLINNDSSQHFAYSVHFAQHIEEKHLLEQSIYKDWWFKNECSAFMDEKLERWGPL